MASVKMSLSTSDPVVLTLSLICAIRSLAEILSLRILVGASKAWDSSIDRVYSVPPFPMIVNFILEPHIHASLDSHISRPSSVEILLNHCVGGVHIGKRRHWHCGINLPIINMGGWLCGLGWETEVDWFRESSAGQLWNADGSTDTTGISYTIGDSPRTLGRCACWFLEGERTSLVQRIAIILGEDKAGFGDLLDYAVLKLSDVCNIHFSRGPIVILNTL